jgi:hypothetical protein
MMQKKDNAPCNNQPIRTKDQAPKKVWFEKGKTRRRKLCQETGLPAHPTCLPIVQQHPRSPNAHKLRGESRNLLLPLHPMPFVNIERVRNLDRVIKWIEGFVKQYYSLHAGEFTESFIHCNIRKYSTLDTMDVKLVCKLDSGGSRVRTNVGCKT